MITYDNFLFENKLWKGTEILSETKAVEIFKNNCSDYFKYNLKGIKYRIVRSVPSFDEDFYYVNPEKYERRSLNTFNYYTLIVNNDPSWQEYPKRKLICRLSGSASVAHYVVIPFNNSKWGVCPEFDMWFSFDSVKNRYSLSGPQEVVDTMHSLFMSLFSREVQDNNISDFKTDLDLLKDELLKHPVDEFIINTKEDIGYRFRSMEKYKFFIEDLYYSENIYSFLVKLFDPKDNGFKHVVVDDFKNIGKKSWENEVWTEGECLLINPYEYYDFIKKAQK